MRKGNCAFTFSLVLRGESRGFSRCTQRARKSVLRGWETPRLATPAHAIAIPRCKGENNFHASGGYLSGLGTGIGTIPPILGNLRACRVEVYLTYLSKFPRGMFELSFHLSQNNPADCAVGRVFQGSSLQLAVSKWSRIHLPHNCWHLAWMAPVPENRALQTTNKRPHISWCLTLDLVLGSGPTLKRYLLEDLLI